MDYVRREEWEGSNYPTSRQLVDEARPTRPRPLSLFLLVLSRRRESFEGSSVRGPRSVVTKGTSAERWRLRRVGRCRRQDESGYDSRVRLGTLRGVLL